MSHDGEKHTREELDGRQSSLSRATALLLLRLLLPRLLLRGGALDALQSRKLQDTTVSIAAPQRHVDDLFDDGDGTYIHAVDGRAEGAEDDGLGLLGGRLRGLAQDAGHRSDGHDEVEGRERVEPVLLDETSKGVVSILALIVVVLSSGEGDFGVRPLSLHLRQPSLTATAALLPGEPARHAGFDGGDCVRVRGNFCVV